MPATQVAALHLYPVKGFQGFRQQSLTIDPAVGVLGDRRYAIRKKRGGGAWEQKGAFYVCMNTPQVANLRAPRNETDDTIDLQRLDALAKEIQRSGRNQGPYEIVDTRGAFALADTKTPCISIINHASVIALQEYVGNIVAFERFRMNVHVWGGLQPFEELSWVDQYPGTKILKIGGLRFRVDDVCERCKAIEANPDTGLRDMELLKLLSECMRAHGYAGSPHRGVHSVMGILATPLDAGIIQRGEFVTLES